MSRISLSRIPSITFYKDSQTLSRRGQPISQLTCIGHPCKLYTPDVVRCENIGGQGTEVDWKVSAQNLRVIPVLTSGAFPVLSSTG